jgi:hypothetical protein
LTVASDELGEQEKAVDFGFILRAFDNIGDQRGYVSIQRTVIFGDDVVYDIKYATSYDWKGRGEIRDRLWLAANERERETQAEQ